MRFAFNYVYGEKGCADTLGVQRKAPHLLELELQMALSYLPSEGTGSQT